MPAMRMDRPGVVALVVAGYLVLMMVPLVGLIVLGQSMWLHWIWMALVMFPIAYALFRSRRAASAFTGVIVAGQASADMFRTFVRDDLSAYFVSLASVMLLTFFLRQQLRPAQKTKGA